MLLLLGVCVCVCVTSSKIKTNCKYAYIFWFKMYEQRAAIIVGFDVTDKLRVWNLRFTLSEFYCGNRENLIVSYFSWTHKHAKFETEHINGPKVHIHFVAVKRSDFFFLPPVSSTSSMSMAEHAW